MSKHKQTEKEIEDEIWELSQDLGELKNPQIWFSRAKSFHFTTKYVIKDHMEGISKGDLEYPGREYMFNIFLPFLYLLATAIELYLKTYLLVKGMPIKNIISYGHKLKELRLKCLSFGDIRFNENSLPYITDTYGRVLLESGGLRYPGRKTPPVIFPNYVDVLDHLETIIKDALEENS